MLKQKKTLVFEICLFSGTEFKSVLIFSATILLIVMFFFLEKSSDAPYVHNYKVHFFFLSILQNTLKMLRTTISLNLSLVAANLPLCSLPPTH